MISNQESLSANKKALLKIRELKRQLADQESGSEPIAIVSAACRFPQAADTPDKFWQQLISKKCFVNDVPKGRWDRAAFYDDDPEAPGKMYTQKGVYLDEIDTMDPEFFGISPREAIWVDPQQRLLMETSWEAIERAGWSTEEIGSSTGVFVGWMHNDYQNEASDSFLNLNPYIATGAAGSFLCGRLAYYLGLNGPALAVDTACSSSLVALHLAVLSLQKAECDQAIVGGVNVICSPTTNILTCKLKALSPNGHSRAFDASADGYLRGEGCGVVTLKRLSDAERAGDRVIGVVRGSAVGHNGFSGGLTAPNPKAQEQVIQQALRKAGVSPHQVSYLEAHGTGTELGDPLEVQAAISAYCQERKPEQPLMIGSVKTNIGHLEAAAGMAGLIKVLLAFEKDQIPGQLYFETPNPLIPWSTAPVKVLTDVASWPNEQAKLAGVSAFGMSGSNAHVIIQDYSKSVGEKPTAEHSKLQPDGQNGVESSWPFMVTLGGNTEEAMFALADEYTTAMSKADSSEIKQLAYTSNGSRKHFDFRAAVLVNDPPQTVNSLRRLAHSQTDDWVITGVRSKKTKVAWQFTGQGSQYTGMAKQLFESEPLFRETLKQCEKQLAKHRKQLLTDVLFDSDERIHDTFWTQPAIFSIQMGLAKLLAAWGIQPDFVLGHSVGQYAAACVAGAMAWEDGLELISERGRLIAAQPRIGKMLAVFANEETVKELTEGVRGLCIGAFNASHIVLSGEEQSIDEFAATCKSRNIRFKPIKTSHAFHSHLMDPVLEEFADFANGFEYQECEIPLACNLSGKILAADHKFDGRYWSNHIRAAVEYRQGLQAVLDHGCNLILELGPRPVLTNMAATITDPKKHLLVGCLDQKGRDKATMIRVAAELFVHGRSPDFKQIYPFQKTIPHRLPTYPFQRRRFWGPAKPRADHAIHHTAHPLLGNQLSLANSDQQLRYQNFVDQDSPSWLPDHQVMDSIVMPGAAWVELAVAAAQDHQAFQLSDIRFEKPLQLRGRTELQTVINRQSSDSSSPPSTFLESFSKGNESDAWVRNFTVSKLEPVGSERRNVDFDSLCEKLDEQVEVEEFYDFLRSIDLAYGDQFQTISLLKKNEKEILAKLVDSSDQLGYHVSPTLLDGAFHSLAVGLDNSGNELFLPVSIGKFNYFGSVQGEVWAHAEWKESEGSTRSADLTLLTGTGQILAEIKEFKVQRLDRAAIRKSRQTGPERLIHSMQWRRSRLPGDLLTDKTWLILGSSDKALNKQKQIQAELESRSHRGQIITAAPAENQSANRDSVNMNSASDCSVLFLDHTLGWADLEKRLSGFSNLNEINGVIWVLADDDETGPRGESSNSNLHGLISLVKRLREIGLRNLDSGLQLVSENACTMEASSHPAVNPRQTQFWGLGRVLSAECPEYRCRLVDVEEQEASNISILVDVLLTESDEGQIAIRNSELFVPRITKMKAFAAENNQASELTIDSAGAYLITGGLGKLGRQAALWLAQKGATEILLVSRRPPNEETREFLKQFDPLECQAKIHQADLSDPQQTDELFQCFGKTYRDLKGVVHAAGILDDGLIENQTWERFDKVLQPKIDAAWNLHRFSMAMELDFFVLYSSVASTLGSPGQSNYATGNAYLDGLACYRRSLGLPGVSLNWGPWSEGMADDPKVKRRLEAQGIVALDSAEAHQALELSLQSSESHAILIDIDWRKLKLGADGRTPKLLSELVSEKVRSRGGSSQLVAKLRKLPQAEQLKQLVSTVQKLFQEVIGSETPPETDRPLIEMGLDSLMAVEFGSSMQMAFGDEFEIGPSILFDHPTIESIAEYLSGLINSDNSSEPLSAQPEKTNQARTLESKVAIKEDIAIIGMSCRFPGAANVEEYWRNLINGVDSVGQIPLDRWDIERFYSSEREPGKMYTREGGFLKDIDLFDAGFFNIPEQEACWIDPQHRLLLENSYHALENAGISTKPIHESNVGVFMGIMGQDYAFLPSLEDKDVIEGFAGAGLSHSAGVGRISFLLGLEGPSVAIDTASSSSLVAVIQAMKSLQDQNCNLALAGGVNVILAPVNSLLMSKAGLLSPDGRCKSFSDQADGFGRGEGCGVVVLKRLSDAERDQDRILAVLRGGAIGHNGFSGGITTPSSKAQVRVLKSALQDAGVSPSEVNYLEAHGTGTEFGDPIELNAAVQVYGKGRSAKDRLVVGSAKANIGHLEAAGGVSGLIKAVLAVQRRVIPPQIHFESPSRHIPWQRIPVEVPLQPREFSSEARVAAVTALGLAGTNAHLILSNWQGSGSMKESESPQVNRDELETLAKIPVDIQPVVALDDLANDSKKSRPYALFISASSHRSLLDLLESYHHQLSDHQDLRFPQLAFESGVGRRHFEARECIVACNQDQAIQSLSNLIKRKNSQDIALEPEESAGSNSARSRSKDKRSNGKMIWYFDEAPAFDPSDLETFFELSPAARQQFEKFEQRFSEKPADQESRLVDFLLEPSNQESSLAKFTWYSLLTQLWLEWGIEPDSVTGKSEGLFAAACAAGVMDWVDAFSMLAFWHQKQLKPDPSQALSLSEFEQFADQFNFYPPDLRLLCGMSGEEIPIHRSLGGSYWREFLETDSDPDLIQALDLTESDTLVLLGRGNRLAESATGWDSISALKIVCDCGEDNSGEGFAKQLLSNLSRLYVAGADANYAVVNGRGRKGDIGLPNYPFEKRRYWITDLAQPVEAESSH